MNEQQEKPTIMVVDDTPANLDLLTEMFHGQGYRVQAFPRGGMAPKAAALKPPDLIRLDTEGVVALVRYFAQTQEISHGF